MSESTELIFEVLTLICFVIYGYLSHIEKKQLTAKLDQQEKQFNVERQQLLDRIQAPSFAEYKHGEAKIIKAQKDEQPKPQIELL